MGIDDKSKVILLAEDDPDDAATAQSALQTAGIANPVIHVGDGDEAMAYLKGEGRFSDRYQYPFPGIVLLDLKMPRVDGFRVLSWLGIQESRKNLLIIVLSGNGELQNIKRAYDLGANSFLIKPFQAADIHNLVKVHRQFWMLSSGDSAQKEGGRAPIPSHVHTNEKSVTRTDTSSPAQPEA